MCGMKTEEARPESESIGHGRANGNGHGNGNGNGVATNGNCDGHFLPKDDVVVNLDRGDPKMYYSYWKKMDDKCVVTIKASELMSYFATVNPGGCFYQLPEFEDAARRVHATVGNAVTEGRYIIGGTGSSQLFTVALRALAATMIVNVNNDEGGRVTKKKRQMPVVCAQPYYSCYEEALEEEKSEIYQWCGDATTFKGEGPYVEVVTTPNNPDGACREPVVNREGGRVICDLAYYWPQYTPITHKMDYDIMLFTLSKATGHAGSRVGWAIVKDKEVALNMIKQMGLMTIGTCHEGQLRATKILDFVADNYEQVTNAKPLVEPTIEGFFEFGHRVLAERWEKLKAVVKHNKVFSMVSDFPSGYCNFKGKISHPTPAYAWMESKTEEDAEKLMMNKLKIRTRGGARFGASSKFIRVSLLDTDENFNLFLERLATLTI